MWKILNSNEAGYPAREISCLVARSDCGKSVFNGNVDINHVVTNDPRILQEMSKTASRYIEKFDESGIPTVLERRDGSVLMFHHPHEFHPIHVTLRNNGEFTISMVTSDSFSESERERLCSYFKECIEKYGDRDA